MVHAGLEAHYSGNPRGWRQAIDDYSVEELGPMQEWQDWGVKAHKFASRMVEGYVDLLRTDAIDLGRDVRDVERALTHTFETQYGPVEITGHADLISDTEHGLTITDHKTSATLYELNQADFQANIYATLYAAEEGVYPDAVEHNILRTVLRERPTKTPAYGRTVVLLNEDQQGLFSTMLTQVVEDIQFALIGDRMYPTPDSKNHCKWCPYAQVCGLMTDGSDYGHVLQHSYERMTSD